MLADEVQGKERVFLDSVAIIYFIEAHPKYVNALRPVFEMVNLGMMAGLSSYISLLEVLVKPLRDGRTDLAEQYRNTLTQSPNFFLFPLEESVASKGAQIRATYNFRTPDSIQLATAELRGAECFVTNDRDLKRFATVKVLVLDDLVPD